MNHLQLAASGCGAVQFVFRLKKRFCKAYGEVCAANAVLNEVSEGEEGVAVSFELQHFVVDHNPQLLVLFSVIFANLLN